jgi:BirA family transcriptional regulator, biotin operon repressor / biotin---[acetyl-CoA-carboxylase] ligase
MLNNKQNTSYEPMEIIEFPLSSFHARVLHFKSIDSTNTFLKEYAQKTGQDNLKSQEAICALADEQGGGRGRMGRSWHSPRGAGLYFSILLKPELASDHAPLFTLMAAVATLEAIEATCGGQLDIKWPNDILMNNRKVAGILTEASFESEKLNYAVLGFGVNLNQKSFPEEISHRATSLWMETKKSIDRDLFLSELLARIDQWYGMLMISPAQIIDRWQQLSSFTQGKSVIAEINGQRLHLTTRGLESNGALRAETDDGRTLILYGGEILTADLTGDNG